MHRISIPTHLIQALVGLRHIVADLGQPELAVAKRLVKVELPQYGRILQADEDFVVIGRIRVIRVIGEVVVLWKSE